MIIPTVKINGGYISIIEMIPSVKISGRGYYYDFYVDMNSTFFQVFIYLYYNYGQQSNELSYVWEKFMGNLNYQLKVCQKQVVGLF